MVFWGKKKSEVVAASNEQNVPKSETANSVKEAKTWYQKALAALRTDIRDLWKTEGQLVDDVFLSELYASLVRTDMGGTTATRIRDSINTTYRSRRIELSDVLNVIREQVEQSLKSKGASLNRAESGPTVILVVGVNGSGKTTSIAKLAHRLTAQDRRQNENDATNARNDVKSIQSHGRAQNQRKHRQTPFPKGT